MRLAFPDYSSCQRGTLKNHLHHRHVIPECGRLPRGFRARPVPGLRAVVAVRGQETAVRCGHRGLALSDKTPICAVIKRRVAAARLFVCKMETM